jgi:hypothetical protein
MTVLNTFGSRLMTSVFVLLIIVVAGCAATGTGRQPDAIAPPPPEIASSDGWWQASFRMYWPQEQEALWHIDLLIAHEIVAPVLKQYKDSIALWRFHRRAARDEAGHQFSLLFYSSAATAYQVFNRLRSNELLSEMKSSGTIISDHYDNTNKITKPRIKDTSDKRWPPSIRKSWPYYIMGASRMWLNLIADIRAGQPNAGPFLSLQDKETLYKEVNAAITELWKQNGRHAFLHHLNALFGYEPVVLQEEQMLKF